MAEIINFKGTKVLELNEWHGYEGVPEHTRAALLRYRDRGYMPGGFLTSVLCNDLTGAVGRADAENIRQLKDICGWVHWRMPASSWGDLSRVEAWVEQGGLEGINRAAERNEEA